MQVKIYQDKNLDYQDFSSKCMIGVQFINCSIRFCNFKHSDLSYSLFQNCDLYQSQFSHAVLYFTRIADCDATKANFENSFLNGIRIKNTVITYAEFGNDFQTHKERKSKKRSDITKEAAELYFNASVEGGIPDIVKLENEYRGIIVNDIAIEFIDTAETVWRTWRRKSEIALIVKRILEENGYKDKSLVYYFMHRKYARKSKQKWGLRVIDLLFNQVFWGYGVRVLNPSLTFIGNCIFFAILYTVIPLADPGSGVEISGQVVNIFSACSVDFSALGNIFYSSFLISTLSVFGSIDVVGYARLFAVLHILISVLLLGLGVAALSKKLANV